MNINLKVGLKNSNSYKKQIKTNLVRCPNCDSAKIVKGLMAPNVTKKSNSKEKAT